MGVPKVALRDAVDIFAEGCAIVKTILSSERCNAYNTSSTITLCQYNRRLGYGTQTCNSRFELDFLTVIFPAELHSHASVLFVFPRSDYAGMGRLTPQFRTMFHFDAKPQLLFAVVSV